jgi:hypothetical protein
MIDAMKTFTAETYAEEVVLAQAVMHLHRDAASRCRGGTLTQSGFPLTDIPQMTFKLT